MKIIALKYVDVGCDDGAGFEMSIFQKPVHILENYGLAATDITDVVITHAHHDHIAAIQPYCNATIHIQETETMFCVVMSAISKRAWINRFLPVLVGILTSVKIL